MTHTHHHLARAIAEMEDLKQQLAAVPQMLDAAQKAVESALDAQQHVRDLESQIRARGQQLLGEQMVAGAISLPEHMTVASAYQSNYEGLADEVQRLRAQPSTQPLP